MGGPRPSSLEAEREPGYSQATGHVRGSHATPLPVPSAADGAARSREPRNIAGARGLTDARPSLSHLALQAPADTRDSGPGVAGVNTEEAMAISTSPSRYRELGRWLVRFNQIGCGTGDITVPPRGVLCGLAADQGGTGLCTCATAHDIGDASAGGT